MKTTRFPLWITLFLFLSGTLSLRATSSWFNSLPATEVSELTIHTDLGALLGQRPGAEEEQPGLLTLVRPDGSTEVWEVDVELRGKFRRRTCDFPPLKLNFSKQQLRDRGFADFDKFKLVTHCLDDRQVGEEQLLRELAVYRMYEALSPYSYRTRLLRVNYVDAAGQVSRIKRYAFLIEPTRELANRLGAEECENCINPSPTELDLVVENRQAVFQYLIGNVDYSLPMARNIKLFRQADGRLLTVPYDFDYSGMVKAIYVLADPDLGQTSIRDRIFLGLSSTDSLMTATISFYKEREEALKAMLRAQDYLPRAARQDMLAYLQTFYDEIDTLRSYAQFREQVRQAIPTGGEPRHYGRR
jgi:hypothetical protein